MIRAELQRRMHEARVEAYARALFDVDAMKGQMTNEQEILQQEKYRTIAEGAITRYENLGLFVAGAERVA